MEVIGKDSAPVAEICCPFELHISKLNQEQEHSHSQQQLHLQGNTQSLYRNIEPLSPSSSSSSSSYASAASSSPLPKKEIISSHNDTSSLSSSSPLHPPLSASSNMNMNGFHSMNHTSSSSYKVQHNHLINHNHCDNHTLVNSLKCKVFTLKQHIEELQSSEALIIGEQKMRIRKLEAAEPLRVKELTEELRSLKRSFVDLLEGQIEELAKVQIDINDVRMMVSSGPSESHGGQCDSYSFSGPNDLARVDEKPSMIHPVKADASKEMYDHSNEYKDDAQMEEPTPYGNQESTIGDESEVIDYESEIRDSQKNIFILQKVLERRTTALRNEVNKLPGRPKHAGNPQKSKSMPGESQMDGVEREHTLDVTPDLTCAPRNPQSLSHTDTSYNARVRLIDSNGVRHTLPSVETDSVDDENSDDDDSVQNSTSEEILKLQRELVELRVSKDSEIGELRCLIAMQNMHYASRIIASHVKIDEIHSKQEHAQGTTSERLDELERETKRLRETLSMSESNDSDGRSEVIRYPQEHDLSKVMSGETIPHANNGPIMTTSSSADYTEAETTCLTRDESIEPLEAVATSQGPMQLSEPKSGHIMQRDLQKSDTIDELRALLTEKENHITALENDLLKANDVIKNVATALDKFENNNEACSSVANAQGLYLDEEVETDMRGKSSSWLKKKVDVLKNKRKRSRRKDKDNHDYV